MLTHTKAKALKEPGRYGDGGGLYLVVSKGGSKKWVQRIVVHERRRDIGLGGFPAISLAKARERAMRPNATGGLAEMFGQRANIRIMIVEGIPKR